MNDKEYNGLGLCLAELGNADLVLSSLATRVSKAEKELEDRIKDYKAKKIVYPPNEKLLAQMKKLDKGVKGGRKSIDVIIKLASDKKKMAAISVADMKKQVMTLFKGVEPAYHDAVALVAIYESISPKPKFILLTAVINYSNNLIEYVNNYKVSLGRWK